jgi:hypothetical protein
MKTYYIQIKNRVLPRLKYFQDDLLTLDRKVLRGYTGELLHASRDSGTDLSCLKNIKSLISLESAYTFLIRNGGNTLYLYGAGGSIRDITRIQASDIFFKWADRIAGQIATEENPDPLVFDELKKRALKKINAILSARSKEMIKN